MLNFAQDKGRFLFVGQMIDGREYTFSGFFLLQLNAGMVKMSDFMPGLGAIGQKKRRQQRPSFFALPAFYEIERSINGDPVNPGGKCRIVFKVGQRQVDFHKNILCDFLCIFLVLNILQHQVVDLLIVFPV